MLTFLSPNPMPIEAATTMGVSAKDGDNPIGRFGTGMKYAIAGVLRLNGLISVRIDGDEYEFTARESLIRGRKFQIVHCNGDACGFTTELGKHWQPWQVFRELASNTMDENGSWTRDAVSLDAGRTLITIKCREVEDAEANEGVFLDAKRTALITSSNGATVYEGPTPYYYYRGIRAGSFDGIAPVTVDVSFGELSEDRLLDRSVVESELAWAFKTATSFDENLMLQVLAQDEDSSFWVRHVSSYALISGELPEKLMQFIAERPKWVKHPAFTKALEKHRSNAGDWSEVEMTPRLERLVSAGETLCGQVGVDAIPRSKVHFTSDLGDQQLAVTRMDTRHVWFSTKLAMLGRDEFLSGYLEEAMHAMTGFRDCTRELQNALLSVIVANASDREPMEAIA